MIVKSVLGGIRIRALHAGSLEVRYEDEERAEGKVFEAIR